MTLDNIYTDHIKPVSVFNLNNEDDFLNCCHYTNLQQILFFNLSQIWDKNQILSRRWAINVPHVG